MYITATFDCKILFHPTFDPELSPTPKSFHLLNEVYPELCGLSPLLFSSPCIRQTLIICQKTLPINKCCCKVVSPLNDKSNSFGYIWRGNLQLLPKRPDEFLVNLKERYLKRSRNSV